MEGQRLLEIQQLHLIEVLVGVNKLQFNHNFRKEVRNTQ